MAVFPKPHKLKIYDDPDLDRQIEEICFILRKVMNIDNNSQALITIASDHHEIHEGHSFVIHDFADVTGAGTTFDIRIVTPDTTTLAHMGFNFSSGDEFTYALYEGATLSGGTAFTPHNADRNSAQTSVLTITSSPTVTAVGTHLISWKTGTGNKTGGLGASRNEMLMKRNTTYLLRITRVPAGTGWAEYSMNWYEHITGDS